MVGTITLSENDSHSYYKTPIIILAANGILSIVLGIILAETTILGAILMIIGIIFSFFSGIVWYGEQFDD